MAVLGFIYLRGLPESDFIFDFCFLPEGLNSNFSIFLVHSYSIIIKSSSFFVGDPSFEIFPARYALLFILS
jgi:hypothetical protein